MSFDILKVEILRNYNLILKSTVDDHKQRLEKAIECCKNATSPNYNDPNQDIFETYPGAVGRSLAVMSGVLSSLTYITDGAILCNEDEEEPRQSSNSESCSEVSNVFEVSV